MRYKWEQITPTLSLFPPTSILWQRHGVRPLGHISSLRFLSGFPVCFSRCSRCLFLLLSQSRDTQRQTVTLKTEDGGHFLSFTRPDPHSDWELGVECGGSSLGWRTWGSSQCTCVCVCNVLRVRWGSSLISPHKIGRGKVMKNIKMSLESNSRILSVSCVLIAVKTCVFQRLVSSLQCREVSGWWEQVSRLWIKGRQPAFALVVSVGVLISHTLGVFTKSSFPNITHIQLSLVGFGLLSVICRSFSKSPSAKCWLSPYKCYCF